MFGLPMMKRIGLSVVLPAVVWAQESEPAPQDVNLLNGKVLKSAVVKSQDPASVTFLHEDGIKRVLIDELSEETRSQLGIGYDKEAAEKWITQQAIAAEKQRGIRDIANIRANLHANMQDISGRLISRSDAGILISRRKGQYDTEIIHLVGNFRDLVDDEAISARGIEAGTFQYVIVLGATKTVRQYFCDLDALVKMVDSGELPGKAELSRPSAGGGIGPRWTGSPPVRGN